MSSDLHHGIWPVLVVLGTAAWAAAQVPTEAELVQLMFPEATITRAEIALDKAQQQAVTKQADVPAPDTVVRHTAKKDGKVVGHAYIDTRKVRTHGQTLVIGVGPDAKVLRVEVLLFAEPRQYRPRPEFFAQFQGRSLDDTLRLRRGIRPVAGATMSAVAAVDAVRTVLAVHGALKGAP